jgi:hypothetical protein
VTMIPTPTQDEEAPARSGMDQAGAPVGRSTPQPPQTGAPIHQELGRRAMIEDGIRAPRGRNRPGKITRRHTSTSQKACPNLRMV